MMMRAVTATIAVFGCFSAQCISRADDPSLVDPSYQHASRTAVERWLDLKYGVRIHWGVYSLLGVEASWPLRGMSNGKKREYEELYKQFNPTDFDAEEWMRLFERCGFRFFTFTAKHHDGFSMFDTRTRVKRRVNWIAAGGPKIEDCDQAYSIRETPFRRDVVRELCTAAARHELAVGLYFSHCDWYDADFRGDRDHPFHDAYCNRQSDPKGYVRMVARHREQIRELLTNYGRVDMLCLDQDHLPGIEWPDMRETIMSARRLQPDCMFRNRGIGAYGDYHTPENYVPDSPRSREGRSPWMVIHTLADTFAYQPDGAKYKPGSWIVSNLIDIAAKGGNFQVAIGPDAQGNFHPEAIKQLEYAGDWLRVNGEAIYNTRPYTRWKEGLDVRFTRSKDGKYVYAISLSWPGEVVKLKQVKPRNGSNIVMLGVAEPLGWRMTEEGLLIDLPAVLQKEHNRPCKQAYVFKIECSSAL